MNGQKIARILIFLLIGSSTSVFLHCAAQNEQMTRLETDIAGLKQEIIKLQQSDQENRAILGQLLARLETMLKQITRSNADVNAEITSLLEEIRSVQGELGSNAHKINDLMRYLNKITGESGEFKPYSDLEPGIPGESGSATFPGSDHPTGTTEQESGIQYDENKLYQNAYRNYLSGEYSLAVEGFKRFQEAFPGSDLADNALYWSGECYYSQKQYRSALVEFYQLIQKYSNGDKVPAAMLKIGLCYLELQRPRLAKDIFETLILQFPATNESIQARENLKLLE